MMVTCVLKCKFQKINKNENSLMHCALGFWTTVHHSILFNMNHLKTMIKTCNSDLVFPCRTTVSRWIVDMSNKYKIEVKDRLWIIVGKVSVTMDSWKSRMFRGYLTITLHYIDEDWEMKSKLLEFVRFPTPHNAGDTWKLLLDILEKWDLTSNIQAVITETATKMNAAMRLLRTMINKLMQTCSSVEDVRVALPYWLIREPKIVCSF